MAAETLTQKKLRAERIIRYLDQEFPEPKTFLIHRNPFELLIATILSAQCTDERVNKVTPALFRVAATPEAMYGLGSKNIEKLIASVNFFRNKSKNIWACSRDLVANFNSQVPTKLEDLVTLAGVGRKTANVVLGSAFGTPGMVVDTHVLRITNRLGLAHSKDPKKQEILLEKIIDRARWVDFSHLLILHGRKTCKALSPKCDVCVVRELCPSKDKPANFWKSKH